MQKYPSLQNFPWAISIEAIKESEYFTDYDSFYQHLQSNLPINSPQTRVKYSNVIQRRLFPDRSLDSIAAKVWKTYHDNQILLEIVRVMVLESEPLIGDFVTQHILTRSPGGQLDTQTVKNYITNAYGFLQEDSYRRMTTAIKDMGFVSRHKQDLFIQPISVPNNSFLILLHDRLARAPRIVRVSEILETKWWLYLGFRDKLQLQETLRKAEAAGLIARYSKVDELEQITTRYSRDEYLKRALKYDAR